MVGKQAQADTGIRSLRRPLGVPGVLKGVDIDTSFFTGNFPPQASIEACVSEDDVPAGGWTEIMGKVDLQGDTHHYLDIDDDSEWTHVRLNIYPDGGIARLRLFGMVRPDFGTLATSIDLLALENGGRAIAAATNTMAACKTLTWPGEASIWATAGKLHGVVVRVTTG